MEGPEMLVYGDDTVLVGSHEFPLEAVEYFLAACLLLSIILNQSKTTQL